MSKENECAGSLGFQASMRLPGLGYVLGAVFGILQLNTRIAHVKPRVLASTLWFRRLVMLSHAWLLVCKPVFFTLPTFTHSIAGAVQECGQ